MSKYEKMVERIYEIPYRKDVTYREVESILLHNNFYIARANGDHMIFKHKNIGGHINIDSSVSFVKSYALRDVKKALDDLENNGGI